MSSVAFTGANLVDGDGPAQPGMTVVVTDNMISLVAPDGTSGVQTVDSTIDLAGLTLMPGMHMCHFHASYFTLAAHGTNLGYGTRSSPSPFGLEEPPPLQAVRAVNNLRTVLLRGFTSVISAGAPYAIDASMKAAITEGAIVGPRMIPGGRDISSTGHSQHLSHKWWYGLDGHEGFVLVDSADDARRAVREETWRGTEIVKLFVTGGHATSRAVGEPRADARGVRRGRGGCARPRHHDPRSYRKSHRDPMGDRPRSRSHRPRRRARRRCDRATRREADSGQRQVNTSITRSSPVRAPPPPAPPRCSLTSKLPCR